MDIENSSIKDLLSKSSSRIEFWIHFLQFSNVQTMVEVGVWKGDFAEQILRSCDLIERYYMLDPWAKLPDWNKPFNVNKKLFDDVYKEAVSKTEFVSDKVVILRGRTKDVIDDIPDGSLDFAYIDGDHTLRGITIDLINILPKVKYNGFIGGDDFTLNPWQHGKMFEPTMVCPFSLYFAEAMDIPIFALPYNQFLIQKKENVQFSFIDYTGKINDISLKKLSQERDKNYIKKGIKFLYRKFGSF